MKRQRLARRGLSMQSHFAGGPIVTVKLPTPSISHSSLSPGTVAATPDGVPVMMTSPAASATISESLTMTSGTFQIICARSPSCRSLPLALSAMRPLLGWPILLAGCNGPQGAEASNALPISHGRFMSREVGTIDSAWEIGGMVTVDALQCRDAHAEKARHLPDRYSGLNRPRRARVPQ